MPEWSKGVDSSSTSASCVGSNPTGVICLLSVRCRRQRPSLTQGRQAKCQFARVVKGVDLRSTAAHCAWVRTPQLTLYRHTSLSTLRPPGNARGWFVTVAILAQGTHRAVATSQAFLHFPNKATNIIFHQTTMPLSALHETLAQIGQIQKTNETSHTTPTKEKKRITPWLQAQICHRLRISD